MLVDKLEQFAKNIIEDIRNAQERTGKKVTGKSSKGLKFTLNNGIQIIDSEGYIEFQEYGRKAGSMPPIKSIQEWIKAKGLNLNAWAVAKSIAKKGTLLSQGKDVRLGLSEILDEARLQEFTKDLNAEIKEIIIRKFSNI